jgi:nudix-type nucleoside diphosphatase (YffH/AdpP family)
MSNKTIKLQKENRLFDGYFKVDAVVVDEFQDGKYTSSYNRFKLTRPDAVTILVFNEDTRKVTLVKQFRFPIIHHTPDNILEAVAGKIDAGETPKQAAIRELHEEVGYKISEDRLSNPIEIFASPGYSTEKLYIFLIVVKDSDKDPNAGGGVAGEHENIEIVEMDLNEFIKKVHSNEIKDSKTIIAANLIKL